MKRVLLTGAAGFIGRRCLAPLRELGYEIHAVDRDVPDQTSADVTWHRADLLQQPERDRVVDAVHASHLLHLAWYVEPGRYVMAPENVGWVSASLALAERFIAGGGRRMVGAGTCFEYALPADPCLEEATPIAPATLYGACKAATGMVWRSLAARQAVSAAWGRIFYLYGPGEAASRLVSSVIADLLAGRPALCSGGDQRRDYLHVDDVAGALAALLDSGTSGAVNIASGIPLAIRDVVRTIAGQLGRDDLVRRDARPTPAGESSAVTADVRRLRDEVGWSPRYDLAGGLRDAIDYWRGQR